MRIPAAGPRARLIALAYGGGLMLWLSLEENSVAAAAALGLGLAALMLVLTTADKLGGRRIAAHAVPLAGALLGAAIGLGAAVASAGLMFFKNALHAHVFPDYPPGLIGALLGRGPAWTLAGALLGLGAGLAWLALRALSGDADDKDDERQI
jgi:hypothetical protein